MDIQLLPIVPLYVSRQKDSSCVPVLFGEWHSPKGCSQFLGDHLRYIFLIGSISEAFNQRPFSFDFWGESFISQDSINPL